MKYLLKKISRSVRNLKIYKLMVIIGIDPINTINLLRGLPFYLRDRKALMEQQKNSNIYFPFGKSWPRLGDRFSNSGTASGQYFHQDLLVARRIFKNKPIVHVDIGSRVDGFVAHVASYRPIQVFDIRALPNKVKNITFIRADLMSDIDESLVDSTDSISCLHALEHFGLGRYGDPVKFDGYLNGLNNIYRILKKSGKFYFSVPIGPQRIEFNAHRVFSINYLLDLFHGKYRVDVFSFVDDKCGDLHEDVSLENKNDLENNFGCHNGCGIFEMTKL